MTYPTLLIEIGTEELPPKNLATLSQAFAENMRVELTKARLSFDEVIAYATPRRLALRILNLDNHQPTREIERLGPLVSQALNNSGEPTPAALGFARSCGVCFEQLQRKQTDKGECLAFQQCEPGKQTTDLLQDLINTALKNLPIAKRMRWGSHAIEFVRPVRWAVVLYGQEIVTATILGLTAGRMSYGHRFLAPHAFELKNADDYSNSLEKNKVMVDFNQRKETIRAQVEALAKTKQGIATITEALLEEATALVEWPTAILGNFNPRFLAVPKEALILALEHHQKAFAVETLDGELQPYFIAISNIVSKQPEQVICGNERVVAARLSDAEFFYQTDLERTLESHLENLKQVLFQDKLGSLYDKSVRIAKLAEYIAKLLHTDPISAQRAGLLCKTDLMSEMVGEFPELQGVMGYYYAKHRGEQETVATALREHYLPRFAGDKLPASDTGAIVALADRLDTLIGIFALNQAPTGEKDPFALRRAAFGVLRILIEKQWPLDLKVIVNFALNNYDPAHQHPQVVDTTTAFMLERLRAWYQESGIRPEVFAAVMATHISNPWDLHQRLQAVQHFCSLPDAQALTAANKRVSNLLLKSDPSSIELPINHQLFETAAEQTLAQRLTDLQQTLSPLYAKSAYTEILIQLAQLREPIDQFFLDVMVMTEDEALRNNRLALLRDVRKLFLQVADISQL